jgi:hypothetical protein
VQKKAAELLKIKPTTLNEMIKRHDIGARRRKGAAFSEAEEEADPPRSRTTAELTRE